LSGQQAGRFFAIQSLQQIIVSVAKVAPQTLTNLDTYCCRIRVRNLSDADLWTFGRRFVWEVLGIVGHTG